MQILLVRQEKEKLRELRVFVKTCYPGSEIVDFTDGAGALAFIRAWRTPSDLCVTEVEMPGVTGFDLTRALREKDGRTKVAPAVAKLVGSILTMPEENTGTTNL